MNYDETSNKIIKILRAAGYKSINVDYDSGKRGPGRYSVSAKNFQGIRVTVAYTGSYYDMGKEVAEYLS